MADHKDDLEADFRVLYRIDDFDTLSGPEFFKLAWRTPFYAGVMQARAVEEERKKELPPSNGARHTSLRNPSRPKDKSGSSVAELGVRFPGMFDMSKVNASKG